MDEVERAIWCDAWKLFREHGAESAGLIDAEITRALHDGDGEAVTRWRQVADAVEELAR